MACNFTQTIQGSECIGDSLQKINNNFSSLDTNLCVLSATVSNIEIPNVELNLPSNFVTSIAGGDSILINGEPNAIYSGDVTIQADNSLQYIDIERLKIVAGTGPTPSTVTLEDATNISVISMPQTDGSTIPQVSFNTIAMGSNYPVVNLHWRGAGQSTITVFATNSALNTSARSNFSPNGGVYALHLDPLSPNLAYIGGSFTKLGTSNRGRFGVVDLNGGSIATDGLGPRGILSSVPGTSSTGQAERNQLNGTATLLNNNVRAIQTFQIGAKRYLCLGGDFTNAIPGDDSPTSNGQRLAIYEITNNYNSQYSFFFNNTVTTLLSAGPYLYVGGRFTAGRRLDSTTNQSMKMLTRINMSDLTIDSTFTQNAASTNTGIWTSGTIQTLQNVSNVLYVGGNHRARLGSSKTQDTHYGLTLHSTTGATPGTILTTFQPIFNGDVRVLKYDSYGNRLYIGGSFTTFRTFGTGAVNATRALALKDVLNNISPTRQANWNPVINNIVNSIELHNPFDTTAPVYVGGTFTKINNVSISRAAAITNANSNNDGALLPAWKPNLNVALEAYNKPGMTRIPATSPLSGILFNGQFSTVGGRPRYYLGRVAGYNETVASTLSSINWKVDGGIIGVGGDLAIDTTLGIQASAQVLTNNAVNTTSIQFTEDSFGGVNRGDMCRFIISRLGTDTAPTPNFFQPIQLVGVSIDYNQETPNLSA